MDTINNKSAIDKLPEPPPSRVRDPYEEPPVKDFSHLLAGHPKAAPANGSGRRRLVRIVVVALLIGAAIGGYYANHPIPAAGSSPKHKLFAHAVAPAPTQARLTSYTSSTFGMSLDYPSDWTIRTSPSSFSLTSPVIRLEAATGSKVKGRVIISTLTQGDIPLDFGTGDATAVLESQLLIYKHPSTTQLAQTYLSFVQYPSATASGTLNAVYVTGNNGYQKDQTVPRADIASLDPLIVVGFGGCTNTACDSLNDLAITAASWSSQALSAPVTAILQSIAFPS
jgi:hypothetical protein